MPSHFIDYRLFGDQFSTPEIRAVWDEQAMLQRWLDVEAALAVARDLKVAAHPIMPVVRALERAAGEHGRWAHWGTTTQDILDTGQVLQMKATHAILRRDLAARHRDTVMAGRTHAQQALPITFGFKVAVWLAECLRQLGRRRHAGRVRRPRARRPAARARTPRPRRPAHRVARGARHDRGVRRAAGDARRHARAHRQRGRAAAARSAPPRCRTRARAARSGCWCPRSRAWRNLDQLGGLLLSEPIMLRLGLTLGRNSAHDVVYEAAMAAVDGKGTFRELLLADARVAGALSPAELDALLDPAAYTSHAAVFVDRIVASARSLLK